MKKKTLLVLGFDEWYGPIYTCPHCGEETIMQEFKFCPNCGGNMEGYGHETVDEGHKRTAKWNENVETCSDCGIHWKKIGESCPVCYAPAEQPTRERKEFPKRK